MRFLITAGPTREYIDSVRYLSNDSSGRMGFALAEAAVRRGHHVTLVHGPVCLPPPDGSEKVPVMSARQMLVACARAWGRCDVLIMAAAVADYMPARPRTTKIKRSRDQRTLKLKPTPDILATLSKSRGAGQVVIGFALEDRNGRRNAAEKLAARRLDAIVLNRPSAIGAVLSQIEVLTRSDGWIRLPHGSKSQTAGVIVKLAESLASNLIAKRRPREADAPG